MSRGGSGRNSGSLFRRVESRIDIINDVLNSEPFLGVFIGDDEVEGFLDLHDYLDPVERIGV